MLPQQVAVASSGVPNRQCAAVHNSKQGGDWRSSNTGQIGREREWMRHWRIGYASQEKCGAVHPFLIFNLLESCGRDGERVRLSDFPDGVLRQLTPLAGRWRPWAFIGGGLPFGDRRGRNLWGACCAESWHAERGSLKYQRDSVGVGAAGGPITELFTRPRPFLTRYDLQV